MSSPFEPTPPSIPPPHSEAQPPVVPPAPDAAGGEVFGVDVEGKPPRRRRWVPLAIGLVLLVALIGGGLALLSNRSSSSGGGSRVALAFAFDRGQTFRYRMEMSM